MMLINDVDMTVVMEIIQILNDHLHLISTNNICRLFLSKYNFMNLTDRMYIVPYMRNRRNNKSVYSVSIAVNSFNFNQIKTINMIRMIGWHACG